MMLTLLKNVRAAPAPSMSMVVATPKPRLVKLAVSGAGQDWFTIGGSARKATHYVVKVEIGGVQVSSRPSSANSPRTPTSGFSAGTFRPS